MGWYRNTKIVFNSIRNYGSKWASKTPIQSSSFPVFLNNASKSIHGSSSICTKFGNGSLTCKSILGSPPICSKFGYGSLTCKSILGSPPISSKFGYGSLTCKSILGSPPICSKFGYGSLNGLKKGSGLISQRYYQNDVHPFNPRGHKRWWFHNSMNVFILGFVGIGIGLVIFIFVDLEVVPLTNRKHVVIVPTLEKRYAESLFQGITEELMEMPIWHILPAKDPRTIRLNLIANGVIGGLEKLLGEVKGEKKSGVNHLEGLKWEVLVVDHIGFFVFCMPNGKIVVFSGLLDYLKTDAEIACIISHEVAHVVARHFAERYRYYFYGPFMKYSLRFSAIGTFFFVRLPFPQKLESEADYIGLLLMAAAGYDPSVAPLVYKKLAGKCDGGDVLLDYYHLVIHPFGKERAHLLSRAQVMEDALQIYRRQQKYTGRWFKFF